MLYDHLNCNAAGHLIFAGMDTIALAAKYGTPLLLMDEQRIRNHCREYKKAIADFLPAGSMPLYASKALSFKGMYRIMAQEEMGIDVVSPGELHTAVRAGFPMASNYNRIPRPPVVMISEGQDTLAVRRESYEDLILCDL